MKRMIYGLVLAAAVAFTGGCEKEKPSPVAASESSLKPKPQSESGEKSLITITSLTTSYSCGAAVCNAIESTPNPPKYNLINIQNSHPGGGTIKYAIYEVNPWPNTPFDLASKLVEFNCSLSATNYANGYLNNGAKIMVYAMHTTDSAPASIILSSGTFVSPLQMTDTDYDFVTMGNYEGTPGCGDPNG